MSGQKIIDGLKEAVKYEKDRAMTDEAFEAQIEAMARAIRTKITADATGLNPHIASLILGGFDDAARAAAEAIGLKPGCVVVSATDAANCQVVDYIERFWPAEVEEARAMIAAAPTPQAD